MTLPSLFRKSAFSWPENLPPSRNQFVSFAIDFDHKIDESVILHLFADTRYRLFLNEEFVAYGPSRFVTQFAEYDSFELAPFLSLGTNHIRVEVNYYGTSSFQSMPDGLPGFIAAGGNAEDSISFVTPGRWRARIHQAWDAQAPLFSFAQNPAEILNTQVLQTELKSIETLDLQALPKSKTPWSNLRPRSVPYPDYHPSHPKQLLLAAPVETTYQHIGVQLHDPDFFQVASQTKVRKRRQLTAWIHSACSQNLRIETFWSEVEVNGSSCELDTSSLQGNHGYLSVQLQKGWNFYSVNVEQLTEHWSYLFGWPAKAGLSVHALPDFKERTPWAILPPVETDKVFPPPSSPSNFTLPENWKLDSGDISRITPARLVAWMRPNQTKALRELPWSELEHGKCFETVAAMWTLDFQDQFYGHPVIEVEAPAGTILEVAYDDWKREDGCVHLYNSNPFTDAADRYILKGGRQTIEVLNPRGGIFIQVVLRRLDGSIVPLTLHNLFVRSRQILKQNSPERSFTCGDAIMDWAWEASTHTLMASTDEAFADCPWRERGCYIGDALVNLQLLRLISFDLSIARRTFRMMGEGQHLTGPRQGQLASVTPAWHRYGHEDFTLIWILCVRDYWRLSGDTSLLEETWPVIQRIWDSPVWKSNDRGLWDVTPKMSLFVDWGVKKIDKTGDSNLILNLFRLGALKATAEIEKAIGRDNSSTHIRIKRLHQAILDTLWNEPFGRFSPSEDHASPCLHGQVLALAFGAGDSKRLLRTIEPELLGNFDQGLKEGPNSGHLELYFHYYLLPSLARLGRSDLAESFIQPHFNFLKSLGYPTLNECFCRAQLGEGSCCHSWSGAPAIYATQNILGLRQKEPGNPDAWIVNPRTRCYTFASGTIPHRNGSIHVSWVRNGNNFDYTIKAPDGVHVAPCLKRWSL